MGNLMSHGLLAGGLTALVNLAIGMEPVSWNLFLAAMAATLLNLDIGDSRTAPGSPLCHSLGGGLLLLYLAGVGAFLSWAFFGMDSGFTIYGTLGIGIGIFAHLVAEAVTGEQVFTFPKGLDPVAWLVGCDSRSTGFWCAWGRFSIKKRAVKVSLLNGFSLALIIACIGLWRGF